VPGDESRAARGAAGRHRAPPVGQGRRGRPL